MRAIVWDWDDDYDDLSSFEPDARQVRKLLPEPPLPPSTAWREGAQAKSPSASDDRAKLTAGILLFATQCAAAALFLVWLTHTGGVDRAGEPIWIFVVIVAFVLGAAAIWRFARTSFSFPEVDTEVKQIPLFDSFPVRVRIVQDRKVTGIDQGVAWFAKDALHFEGLESEFVIGAQDLRYDPLAIGVGRGALEHGWATPTLALRHPDRALSIVFQPPARVDRRDKRDSGYKFRHHLRLFLQRWRQSRVDSLYPPLARQASLAVQKGRAAVDTPVDASSPAEP